MRSKSADYVLIRDASVADPNLERELPKETADAPTLKSMFAAKGFTPQEMVALSGAHSIGASQVAQPIVSATPCASSRTD